MISRTTIIQLLNRLDSLRYDEQEMTPGNWCLVQPCKTITLFSRTVIITQPSSTVFVYLLGIFTVGVGIYYLQIRDGELSRLWWGVSLVLWGIGALLAGTSYQAFAYEIKCAGRPVCRWTSWWELTYLIFQQVSMNVLLVAVAYSSTTGTLRLVLLYYAVASSVAYCITTIIGGVAPARSLVTFTFMVRASTPPFVFVFLLSVMRSISSNNPMDQVLLRAWIMLIVIGIAYFLYDEAGLTEKLWEGKWNVWFSQNDLLHIGLIFWMIYIGTVLAPHVCDFPGPCGIG